MSSEGFREYWTKMSEAEQAITDTDNCIGMAEDGQREDTLAIALGQVAIARSIVAFSYGLRLVLNEMKNELA